MNFDQLGQSWRDENEKASAEERLASYVATTRAAERFTERIFRRDLIETIACLAVIGCFGYFLIDGKGWANAAMPAVSAAGMVINILGAVFVMYRLHRVRTRTPRPRLDAPMREYCDLEIARVEQQIDLLRSVHVWYLAPFFVGVTLVFLGAEGFCPEFWLATALVTGAYAAMYAVNRAVAATSMTVMRDRLVWLRDQLEAGDDEVTEPPDRAAADAAVRRLAFRLFWGALGIGVGGILLGMVFDPMQPENPKRAPFDAIRWRGDKPEVRLDEEWFNLFGVDGVATSDLVDFCQSTYSERKWRQRIEEDLVEVLTRMGHPPDDQVYLLVSPLDDKLAFEQRTVPMNEEKRSAIKRAAAAREDAGLPRHEILDEAAPASGRRS